MLIGDPAKFAIESQQTHAWEEYDCYSCGYFLIHILGREYGIRDEHAGYLSPVYSHVRLMIRERGERMAPFSHDPDAAKIVIACLDAYHKPFAWEDKNCDYFGLRRSEICDILRSRGVYWSSYSDPFFDDSSLIYQFDVGNQVRLIGYHTRRFKDLDIAAEKVSDLWLPQDEFYGVLERWCDALLAEWKAMPKEPDPDAAPR